MKPHSFFKQCLVRTGDTDCIERAAVVVRATMRALDCVYGVLRLFLAPHGGSPLYYNIIELVNPLMLYNLTFFVVTDTKKAT